MDLEVELISALEEIEKFSTKCPYPKQEDSDDEEPCSDKKDQKSKTIYTKKFNKKKKTLYSMDDNEDEDISKNKKNCIHGNRN